ncbi:hypothetical protein BRADI_5g22466v3 [Brachypodium distachyon]|uniref:BTB domain-containing protein n=2 Tax=Brachypodium distachyon TaxID=15368 RepID=A0A0Q3IEY0_BRADI|nr:hypothetical protein BRADI_5g22466v3 [Brachypodium distachyon]
MASSSITPETTTSRCTLAVESATLSFDVNYPQIDGMGAGQFVSSGTFRVGGYDWSLRFYPDGVYADCGGHASCYACSPNLSIAARTSYLIQILEKDQGGRGEQEEEEEEQEEEEEPAVLSSACDDKSSPEQLGCSPTLQDACWGMGYPKFVPKAELKSLSEKPGGGGVFTVKCLITVANESPPMELPGHLGRMLADGAGADVTFRVGRRRFRAHGFVLAARSRVFEAQLFGPMAEKDLGRVKVVGVEPAVFEAMLGYIYTDSLPPWPCEGSLAAMQHLLVAADRYGLDALKLRCEEELCGKIDLESVTGMLWLAN